jgi:hypothetical protein
MYKIAIVIMACAALLFAKPYRSVSIVVDNGVVQERTLVRTGHKVTAFVEEYRVGTFEPIKKYEVDVLQKRGRVTRIEWDKMKGPK